MRLDMAVNRVVEGVVICPRIGLLLSSNSFAWAISQFSLKLDSTNTDTSTLLALSSDNFKIQCRISLLRVVA